MVVERRIYGVVGYVLITLLQIVRRVCQWKNFENRSVIGDDMDKSKVACFYGPRCIIITLFQTEFKLEQN